MVEQPEWAEDAIIVEITVAFGFGDLLRLLWWRVVRLRVTSWVRVKVPGPIVSETEVHIGPERDGGGVAAAGWAPRPNVMEVG